jgi:transposase-like protein
MLVARAPEFKQELREGAGDSGLAIARSQLVARGTLGELVLTEAEARRRLRTTNALKLEHSEIRCRTRVRCTLREEARYMRLATGLAADRWRIPNDCGRFRPREMRQMLQTFTTLESRGSGSHAY